MKILYVQYTNPANYPPLEHGGILLTRAGWDVHFFGIHSEGESNKLAFPALLAGRETLWQCTAPGWRQKLHFVAFTGMALWRAWWSRPDWVYCSDLMSCPAAWLIGGFSGCRVVYHEHDSPEEGLAARPGNAGPTGGQRSPSGFKRFLFWTRRRVGRRTDLVVLPNEKRLELFVKRTARTGTSLCVYNCPRREEVWAGAARPVEPGKLRIAFHGSINRDRLPLAILEAMARFPGRIHLTVVGYETVGCKGYLAEFLGTATRLGLVAAVEFLGALPRHAIFEPAARCDVGLAFMPPTGGDVNLANMTGASNKPFDYLACGLAVLVTARPEWEKMFVAPGYGRACDPGDAESLAGQLGWFLEHPRETRAMGTRGRERVLRDWNYEAQFAPVSVSLK